MIVARRAVTPVVALRGVAGRLPARALALHQHQHPHPHQLLQVRWNSPTPPNPFTQTEPPVKPPGQPQEPQEPQEPQYPAVSLGEVWGGLEPSMGLFSKWKAAITLYSGLTRVDPHFTMQSFQAGVAEAMVVLLTSILKRDKPAVQHMCSTDAFQGWWHQHPWATDDQVAIDFQAVPPVEYIPPGVALDTTRGITVTSVTVVYASMQSLPKEQDKLTPVICAKVSTIETYQLQNPPEGTPQLHPVRLKTYYPVFTHNGYFERDFLLSDAPPVDKPLDWILTVDPPSLNAAR